MVAAEFVDKVEAIAVVAEAGWFVGSGGDGSANNDVNDANAPLAGVRSDCA